MKIKSDGETEFEAFTKMVDRLLSVPHSEIKKRAEAYRKKAEKNPNRRGPKRKAKPVSASRVPAEKA